MWPRYHQLKLPHDFLRFLITLCIFAATHKPSERTLRRADVVVLTHVSRDPSELDQIVTRHDLYYWFRMTW